MPGDRRLGRVALFLTWSIVRGRPGAKANWKGWRRHETLRHGDRAVPVSRAQPGFQYEVRIGWKHWRAMNMSLNAIPKPCAGALCVSHQIMVSIAGCAPATHALSLPTATRCNHKGCISKHAIRKKKKQTHQLPASAGAKPPISRHFAEFALARTPQQHPKPKSKNPMKSIRKTMISAKFVLAFALTIAIGVPASLLADNILILYGYAGPPMEDDKFMGEINNSVDTMNGFP